MTRAKPFDQQKKRGPKPQPPMFSFEQAKALVDRYIAGEGYRKFAEEHGVSSGKIQREINKGYYDRIEERSPGEGIAKRKADTHEHWVVICAIRDGRA